MNSSAAMQETFTQLEVLRFELAGQDYAFATADVVEVLRAVAIAPLPRAPAIVDGVVNMRGAVVPVLDIRTRFGLAARSIAPTDHFIVVATDRRIAVRVDRCVSIATVEMIAPAEARVLPRGVSHVRGFGLIPEGLLVIHDLREFLAEAEALALDAALAGHRVRPPGVPA